MKCLEFRVRAEVGFRERVLKLFLSNGHEQKMKTISKIIFFFFLCNCSLLHSGVDEFDLQFRYPPKIRFDGGSITYNPTIRGADGFLVDHNFQFELMTNKVVGNREWVSFSREGRDLVDAIIGINGLKDGVALRKKKLIEIVKNKNQIKFVVFRDRESESTQFTFSCSVEDALSFAEAVKKMDAWIAGQFEKKSK